MIIMIGGILLLRRISKRKSKGTVASLDSHSLTNR